MPLPTFPAYAKLKRDNFAPKYSANVLRTDMESAIAKQRPMNTLAMKQIPVVYALDSKADYNSFIAWVRTTLVMGTGWFTWTDPIDAAAKRSRIIKGLDGVSSRPLNSALSLWEVSFTVETIA